MHVLLLSLPLRESKFTLSWLLRNTQQDISYWWVRKLWNEGRDRSLQKEVPCLYLLVCKSSLQCRWGCTGKAECRKCTVLWVGWVRASCHMKATQFITHLLPWLCHHMAGAAVCVGGHACLCLHNGNVVRTAQGKAQHPVCVGRTCMGGTRALHMSFGIHMAFVRNFNTSVCHLLLWDSFLLLQWCEGRPSFTQKPLRAAGPNFYNGSTCRQGKRSFAFMLLCNLGFIPQRPSPAKKNKTLHANGYFCHHLWRWHLLYLFLAQDAGAAESIPSSREVQEIPWPVRMVTCLGGRADGEAQTFSSFWQWLNLIEEL